MIGCVSSEQTLPTIRIVTWPGQPQVSEYLDGALVWSPLGFGATLDEQDQPECARGWYVTGETDCVLTIGVQRVPNLRETAGTSALSNRAERSVVIDSRLSGYDLILAMAHETGHIVLDTPSHTQGGVMGGASTRLEQVDYELACEAIGYGCQ